MLLRFTVRDAANGQVQDVELVAEPATPIASLVDALPAGVHGRPCYVSLTPLDPEGTRPRALPGRPGGLRPRRR
jgi:hypothetical protein